MTDWELMGKIPAHIFSTPYMRFTHPESWPPHQNGLINDINHSITLDFVHININTYILYYMRKKDEHIAHYGEAVSTDWDRGNGILNIYIIMYNIYYYIKMIMTKFLSKSFRNDVAKMSIRFEILVCHKYDAHKCDFSVPMLEWN